MEPMHLYHSPFEAYPFLSDAADDLRCDFELLTDEMTSRTGLLHAQMPAKAVGLRAELLWVGEMIYHINPTLRTHLSVTPEECTHLQALAQRLKTECEGRCALFVLPQGCEAACTAHLLRVQGKCLVRLLYRHARQGHEVPPMLFDLANLLSGYFFYLALHLNALAGVDEIPYESRNYKPRTAVQRDADEEQETAAMLGDAGTQ